MEPTRQIRSRTAVLLRDNVDTDQIIPARFLSTTRRTGLGTHAFAGWRYGPGGETIADFPLNRPGAAGRAVLIAGHNFGCGSSREHAVWALLDLGVRAVISSGIADIFRSNALRNGLVPVEISAGDVARLAARPGDEVIVDLEACVLRERCGRETPFPLDPFARYCLLNGIDSLGYLLAQGDSIARYEENLTCKQ